MILKQILQDLEIKKSNIDEFLLEKNITSVEINSLKCKKDCIFVCLKGKSTDGFNYIQSAIKNGAILIVTEKFVDCEAKCIVVENTRKILSKISANFYNNPANNLKLIGITGTNGKTTTANMIKDILSSAGHKVGIIGTLGAFIGEKKIYSDLTTPDPMDLHQIFAEMLKNKIEYVVMEISAHAIALQKIYGLKFEIGIFTNLSQDHLDYFSDMKTYKNVKKSFFTPEYVKCAVVNNDDPVGKEIYDEEKIPIVTYGLKNPSDCFAIDILTKISGTSFSANLMDNIMTLKMKFCGVYNVYNMLAATTCCLLLGVNSEHLKSAVYDCKNVNGRFETYIIKNFNVIIDFAHTPDALEKLLMQCKEFCCGKIICVFGAPGSRDVTKRPLMASIVEKYSDFIVVTSDNPKYENVNSIYNDIKVGFKQKSHINIKDRAEAIEFALNKAKKDDFVVICGKGGEDYQDINSVKVPYKDVQIIENYKRSCK